MTIFQHEFTLNRTIIKLCICSNVGSCVILKYLCSCLINIVVIKRFNSFKKSL